MRTFLISHSVFVSTILLLGMLSGAHGHPCHAAGEPIHAHLVQDNPSPSKDSTNDGPHVLWKTDTSAIVFYLCGGTVDSQNFAGIDTLRFYGFCEDSNIEYTVTAELPAIEPYIINDAPEIIAVSDVHGEYELLVDILVKTGVVDGNLHWIWGDGHLVIVGDVFDRGDKVTECLWLVYRLEQEAKESGGRVHFILGNHELMVLRGDNRYVHEKYLDGIVERTRIKHEDLYGPDMQLGRWLRTKHAAIRINDILFVHAGISPFLVNRGLRLKELNETVRNNIDIRSSQLAFNDLTKFLFGNKGPFWYRGYHYEMENRYPRTTEGEIDSILSFYGASAIVVGHTEVDRISGYYGNRVIAIDVPVEDLGNLQALLWKDNRFYRVTGAGDLMPVE